MLIYFPFSNTRPLIDIVRHHRRRRIAAIQTADPPSEAPLEKYLKTKKERKKIQSPYEAKHVMNFSSSRRVCGISRRFPFPPNPVFPYIYIRLDAGFSLLSSDSLLSWSRIHWHMRCSKLNSSHAKFPFLFPSVPRLVLIVLLLFAFDPQNAGIRGGVELKFNIRDINCLRDMVFFFLCS